MDIVLLLKTIVMALVEGITEFLPVSSTGHLIIAGDLLNFLDKEKRDVFEVAIQLAAILAICWEYRARLWNVARGVTHERSAQRFVGNLLIAFLPAAFLGLIFIKAIKEHLFSPVPVAIALIIGGFLILWAEKRKHTIRVLEVEDMTPLDALKIGCAQCLALIPGTSRSGATIIGGLFFGLSRKAATEFSFFLAIPTMFAATLYDLIKHRALFSADDLGVLAVGSIFTFISSLFVVRGLIRYVSNHDFTVFAWYRIGFGLLLIALTFSGAVTWAE
ncbi:undecaprenyl-diphosphatase (bacitracin resistance protein) [gamma proteobacterium HdN1]|nr:undecaprenyl-diphosphatase (bacitracin resistance protein) [gamma proteobacterium HdN1]